MPRHRAEKAPTAMYRTLSIVVLCAFVWCITLLWDVQAFVSAPKLRLRSRRFPLQQEGAILEPPPRSIVKPVQDSVSELEVLDQDDEPDEPADEALRAVPALGDERMATVHPLDKDKVRTMSKKSASRSLEQRANEAWDLGRKVWKEVEALWRATNFTGSKLVKTQEEQQKCPQVLMVSADEFRAGNNVTGISCGLQPGSAITVTARALKAHPESNSQITLTAEEPTLISQFFVELRGIKIAAGEDPPRILHVNPRLRGDWSSKPVIELNTGYRGQWGVPQRCEGYTFEERVDGLRRCESWLTEPSRSSANNNNKPGESWLSTWLSRSPVKEDLDWRYPLREGALFVFSIQAGWEGYHVSIDGRHITSFPYRPGYVLEDATGLAIGGDIDVRSVVVTSLPMKPSTMASELLLEANENLKAPKLREGVIMFIGIISASKHFTERMAVRKSWMQSKSILSSDVAARFFVALDPDKEVNLRLKAESEYFGDMVILPFMDHYDLVVLKTLAICEFAVRDVKSTYIMKTDDDTFVGVETVLNRVRSMKREALGVYMGNINQFHRPLRVGKWAVTTEEWPEEEYPPYANGPGYIISDHIAQFILQQKKKNSLRKFKMEDVSMGMWVLEYNLNYTVQYVQEKRFVQYGCADGYYTAHYQSPRQMLCMWAKLQLQGEPLCCNL